MNADTVVGGPGPGDAAQEPVDLRLLVRALVYVGKLPRRAPDQIRGGSGEGLACTVCLRPIGRDELELKAEGIRLHRRCYDAWMLEIDQTSP